MRFLFCCPIISNYRNLSNLGHVATSFSISQRGIFLYKRPDRHVSSAPPPKPTWRPTTPGDTSKVPYVAAIPFTPRLLCFFWVPLAEGEWVATKIISATLSSQLTFRSKKKNDMSFEHRVGACRFSRYRNHLRIGYSEPIRKVSKTGL